MIKRRQILIAGMGTSPAVLTNAVWALAHQEKTSLKESLTAAQKVQVDSSLVKAEESIGGGMA